MYNIGQVLYVVLAKKNQVYPMQVTEVITKKTLKGEEVRYLLQAGTGASTVMLDQIDGEVFETADVARKTLVSRATQQVHRLVDAAVKKAEEWYHDIAAIPQGSAIHELPDLESPLDENEEASPEASVMLPDGTVAKVKLPTV